jgi:hypothetical protein
MFCSSTTEQKITHFCVYTTTLNTFVLMTATSAPTILKRKRIVAFPRQHLLRERNTMYRCTHIICCGYEGCPFVHVWRHLGINFR